MANRKNFYYVLVMTNTGPVFVTDIPERNKAVWDRLKIPMEFGSKSYAQDVATGLKFNGHLAYMVVHPYELDYQPYLYSKGKFKWADKED